MLRMGERFFRFFNHRDIAAFGQNVVHFSVVAFHGSQIEIDMERTHARHQNTLIALNTAPAHRFFKVFRDAGLHLRIKRPPLSF